MRNHNKMSRDLCVWWNRKSRPQVVCKKNGESSAHADHIFSKQNGRTVPSESERSIEKLARVPSMQTVVFWCAPAAQYAADAKAVKNKWRAFRPYKWLFCTMLRPHSTQRARKLPGKELRELRPCRMCSMQLTQELSQKNGESSVHANRDFSYLRRQTLRFISIRQRKHKA